MPRTFDTSDALYELWNWLTGKGTVDPSVTPPTLGNVATLGANTFGGTQTIHPATDVVGLVVEARAPGTADLQQWQNSAGTVLAKVGLDGSLAISGTTSPFTGLSVTGTGTTVMSVASSGVAFSATFRMAYQSGQDWRIGNASGSNDFELTDVTAGNKLRFSCAATTGLFTLWDGGNIALGTVTGTQLGTSVSQKWAAHGATPVVQRAGAAQAAVATTASTQTTPFGYTTAAQADGIVTLVNEIRATLVEKGIMKGAA